MAHRLHSHAHSHFLLREMHRRDFRLLNENLIEPRVDFPQYSVDLSQLLMLSHLANPMSWPYAHSYRPLRYNKKPARIENIQHVLLCFKPITCLLTRPMPPVTRTSGVPRNIAARRFEPLRDANGFLSVPIPACKNCPWLGSCTYPFTCPDAATARAGNCRLPQCCGNECPVPAPIQWDHSAKHGKEVAT